MTSLLAPRPPHVLKAIASLLAGAGVTLGLAALMLLLNAAATPLPAAPEPVRLAVALDSPRIPAPTPLRIDPGGSSGDPQPDAQPVAPDVARIMQQELTPEPPTPIEPRIDFELPPIAPVALSAAPSPVKIAAPPAARRVDDRQLLEELGLASRTPRPRAAGTGGSGTGAGTGTGSGSGPMRGDRIDKPPRPLYTPKPLYPEIARRLGIHGKVAVECFINERGEVVEFKILGVEGHDAFGQSVRQVLGKYRYEPGVHQGRAVPTIVQFEVKFELKGK